MAGRASALLEIEEEVEEIRAEIAALESSADALQETLAHIQMLCLSVEQKLIAGDVALTHAISMMKTLDALGTPRSQRRIRELARDTADADEAVA